MVFAEAVERVAAVYLEILKYAEGFYCHFAGQHHREPAEFIFFAFALCRQRRQYIFGALFQIQLGA